MRKEEGAIEAIKSNLERFPDYIMFRLTEDEF